ncbi:MAG TPA: acyltransferase [Rhodanobacteraceae bacterium]|nr:acyltransferase [Rhodanobacteraceae bacterium]
MLRSTIRRASESRGEASTAADPPSRLRAFFWGRSLDECIASGRDNILQLRLIAALLVLLGHSNLAGPSRVPFDIVHALLPATYTHVTGLFIFFVVSGILITLSFQRRPDLARFLRARFLRIWPALAVCVLAWAFVLGPIASTLPLSQYFAFGRADSPYHYVRENLSMFGFSTALPGVFANARVAAGQVDTPLWSIPVEATMYLYVAAAGVLRLLRFPWLTSLVIAGFFTCVWIWPVSHGELQYMKSLDLTVRGFFGAGAILCLLRRYVRVSNGIMLAIAAACFVARSTIHALPFAFLAIGYFVLWFAYVPRLPRMPRDADLSYATYLWGWPLQQAVATFGHVTTPILLFAIVAPIAMGIAVLSWFFVEKPALRLKDVRLPRIHFGRRSPSPPLAPPAGDMGSLEVPQPPAQA